ncbi:hypothetical protein GQ600_10806 [Phytophthora cactorum]|nr:hypothetical protein GQ600_10806 [Phytophthora cactorum]
MTSISERLLLSLALGAALAVCGYYCSKLVGRRRPKSLAALKLTAAPRVSLSELQRSGRWVALCGTAFDGGDPFFDETAGIYSLWVCHDVAFLLLQLGLSERCGDAEAVASYLDREWPLDALQGDEEAVKRRYELVQEWFVRFHSRYEVVAQLSDRYVGAKWDALRAELLPDSSVSSGGKCPLDSARRRLFHPDGGQFAHFVGHDVTYALAVRSIRMQDLDVTPERAYTFEEQLLLERYRNFFARELAILEVDGEQEGNGNRTEVVNVHQVIEESDSMAQEECVKYLKKRLKVQAWSK